jgi:hypothetical protein
VRQVERCADGVYNNTDAGTASAVQPPACQPHGSDSKNFAIDKAYSLVTCPATVTYAIRLERRKSR